MLSPFLPDRLRGIHNIPEVVLSMAVSTYPIKIKKPILYIYILSTETKSRKKEQINCIAIIAGLCRLEIIVSNKYPRKKQKTKKQNKKEGECVCVWCAFK